MPAGEAIDEQLERIGIKPSNLDLVLLSHLDCDHVNGLKLVTDAKQIVVSKNEMAFAHQKTLTNRIRYYSNWWNDTKIETFEWNDTEGPASRSFDVFGDGCLQMINIPGHTDGLCALKVTNSEGKYVLLYSDGGYASRSWQEMIVSGLASDKSAQKKSLAWIREQSMNEKCIASMANHDPDIKPCIISL